MIGSSEWNVIKTEFDNSDGGREIKAVKVNVKNAEIVNR